MPDKKDHAFLHSPWTRFFYFRTRNNTIDVTRNMIAATDVYLLNRASIVLPLFFPKNVSAPPAIEPDNPADFPDCKRTIMIMESENII